MWCLLKKSKLFFDKHSHDFKVDIIIITGTFEIELSNSNIILFPGSRLKLIKAKCIQKKQVVKELFSKC